MTTAKEYIEKYVDDFISKHFNDYATYYPHDGYIYGGEYEIDKGDPRGDGVQDLIDTIEYEQFEKIDDFMFLPEVVEELKKLPGYDKDQEFLYGNEFAKEALANFVKKIAFGETANA